MPATQRIEATEATVIDFSCEGKITSALSEKPEPTHNVGLVVNLVEKTVSFAGYVAPFNKVDAANIYFSGTSADRYGISVTVAGNVDRVTGAVDATIASTAGSAKTLSTSYWKMLCKPTSS